mmetsp:Transcript_10656/g.32623  ORF Transcript_10656/g.32623 Transcript_10656/m.32623 type:complete len:249 (+) Transcript_10656:243-989(+)
MTEKVAQSEVCSGVQLAGAVAGGVVLGWTGDVDLSRSPCVCTQRWSVQNFLHELTKSLADTIARFCACLDVNCIGFLCKSSALLRRHFPWLKVDLVSHDHLDKVCISAVVLQLRQPVLLQAGEGLPTGHVVHKDDSVCSPVICTRQRSKALLSGCVPKRQLDSLALHIHLLRLEVHSYRLWEVLKHILRVPQQDGALSYCALSHQEDLELFIKLCAHPVQVPFLLLPLRSIPHLCWYYGTAASAYIPR